KTGTVQVATVLGTSSSSHLMHHLSSNTHYTFFMVPFWHSIEGTPSNSQSLTTPEDVPASAPGDVRITVREDSSVLIRWSHISAEDARGKLVGYKVTISYNGSQTTETVMKPWLEARSLLPGHLYTVRVAALTAAGPGPFSDPVLLDAGPNDAHIIHRGNVDSSGSVIYASPQPQWLVYLLIPLVLLVFMITLVYIRQLRKKASSSNPPQVSTIYQDPSIYPDQNSINMYGENKLWHPSESDKDSSVSSARLFHPHKQMNEYAEPRVQELDDSTELYVTTALLTPPSPNLNYNIPWQHQGDDSRVQVNWGAFLPPPPACPPPLDLDDLANGSNHQGPNKTSPDSQHDNNCRFEECERAYSDASEHTYDVYTQVMPVECQDGLLTFNTKLERDCRKVKVECHPSLSADPP
ncbi:hypothetical protein OTU49_009408, partial [Cherax quadricarinatus]